MRRRALLQASAAGLLWPLAARAAEPSFAAVVPGRVLRFPEDEGSHPDFRTEWWYVTGWLNTAASPIGFQVTFFRTRPHARTGNPSRFAPDHLLIAHAALSEPAHKRMRHAQRAARAGFGLAQALTGRTSVRIDDWRIEARGTGYVAWIDATDFGLDLQFAPTQAPLLQGDAGFSRKGPRPESASYYYSLPQLKVDGRVRVGTQLRPVEGLAWLDHEWSSEYLPQEAVGWDWAGINMDDGGALMAFRMRGRDGSTYWASAIERKAEGNVTSFAPDAVAFTPLRQWRSPRTGALYPTAMRIRAGAQEIELNPLMDDQENDARITTGAVYWEGAVTASNVGRRVGRGYLELTGYAKPLKL